VDWPIEGKSPAIEHPGCAKLANEGTDDAAADELSSVAGDEMHFNVSPWQEAHLALRHHSGVRDIDDGELPTSAQAYL
jgi:hypothetical protein